jgi:hypothetical protein
MASKSTNPLAGCAVDVAWDGENAGAGAFSGWPKKGDRLREIWPCKERPPKGPRRLFAFLDFAGERAKKVCGLRGFAGRREDRSIILLEERNPRRDVLGVA